MKRLLKQVGPGLYQGYLYGSQVTVERMFYGRYKGTYKVMVKQGEFPNYKWEEVAYKRTVKEAFDWLRNVWGAQPVMTRNLLNPEAGEFPIARKYKGGCCDPGTETYHCM